MTDERIIDHVLREVRKAVVGKDDVILTMFTAMLAGGHVLLEDIPGVGKTTLAVAFSRAFALNYRRMQFTPDVLPSDVIGFTMYDKESGKFVYREGSIMCNLFLADEINRTSSKTQSALLEVMEEGKVTVDGITREVPKPFLVIATQNPSGSAGTQLLPESQLDRFMVRMSVGYPDLSSEVRLMKERHGVNPLEQVEAAAEAGDLYRLQLAAEQVYVKDELYEYVARLAARTREHELTETGVSPRGSLAVIHMAKAAAYIRGRDFVIPSDIRDIYRPVCGHRIVLSAKARIASMGVQELLDEILESVPAPKLAAKKRQVLC